MAQMVGVAEDGSQVATVDVPHLPDAIGSNTDVHMAPLAA